MPHNNNKKKELACFRTREQSKEELKVSHVFVSTQSTRQGRTQDKEKNLAVTQ